MSWIRALPQFTMEKASTFTSTASFREVRLPVTTALSSTAEQAGYLARAGAGGAVNWEATQCHGLITTALAFPEFTRSSDWLRLGVARIQRLLQSAVYPDGLSTEQSTSYDIVTMRTLEQILQLFEAAGAATLASSLRTSVERMYDYLAKQMSSDGMQVMNGDSGMGSLVSFVSSAAVRFRRPDWLYLATRGKDGVMPKQGYGSAFFAWGGQLIMQSKWGADSRGERIWAWFCVGPFGSSSHGHLDKLHLSLRAHGEHFLVDAGEFGYGRDGPYYRFRAEYGILTQAHNVVQLDQAQQVDRCGTHNCAAISKEPISNATWGISAEGDVAFGSVGFDLDGVAVHTRGLRHLREAGVVVVVDRVSTDRPRNVTTFWHVHPNRSVACRGGGSEAPLVTLTGRSASVSLVGANGSTPWQSLEVVKGRLQPTLQGWYSNDYDTKVPSPAVVVQTRIDANSTFVWVIATSATPALPPQIRASVEGPIDTRHPANGTTIKVGIVVDGEDLGVVNVPI